MTNTQSSTLSPQSSTRSGQAAVQRQLVNFCFLKVDPAWHRLPAATRQSAGQEFLQFMERQQGLMIYTYSLVGLKAECDLLIWRIGQSVEQFTAMSAARRQTVFGSYQTVTHSFLSMTRRSTYVDKLNPEHEDERLYIVPAQSKYLFVYPFVKTREWYALPLSQRQEMMDEHIRIGAKYRSVRLHTTYSFGLDDQEFVVAFETDAPSDFLDLVMELRESKASRYTLRDTPIFTCVRQPLPELLASLGAC